MSRSNRVIPMNTIIILILMALTMFLGLVVGPQYGPGWAGELLAFIISLKLLEALGIYYSRSKAAARRRTGSAAKGA